VASPTGFVTNRLAAVLRDVEELRLALAALTSRSGDSRLRARTSGSAGGTRSGRRSGRREILSYSWQVSGAAGLWLAGSFEAGLPPLAAGAMDPMIGLPTRFWDSRPSLARTPLRVRDPAGGADRGPGLLQQATHRGIGPVPHALRRRQMIARLAFESAA